MMMRSNQRSARKRNNGGERNSKQGAALPLDIIQQILCRLPAESIISCSCVCKSWYALIHERPFIQQQLERTKNEPCQYLLQSRTGAFFQSLLLLDIHKERLAEISFKKMKLPTYPKLKLLAFYIVCSCNGLLCLAPKEKMDPVLICNPITKDCLILPSAKTVTGFERPCKSYHLGFHLDSSSGNYKVVREYTFTNNAASNFQLISVGESSWKVLSGAPDVVLEQGYETPIFWNGAFHWKISEVDHRNGNNSCILALDLSDEKFHTISFPEDERNCPRNYRLVDLGGALNIVEHNARFLKIWTVSGNKVGGFSIRLEHMYILCVPPRSLLQHDLICQLEEKSYLMQVFRWENGIQKCRLVKFCPAIARHLDLSIPGLPSLYRVVCFKPSLVSPFVASLALS
ncbi:F-box protein At5g65850-like [Hevea brasiliensis]|nr:F-box protein At5g65850-like [Hevea brasiliensis]